jgi:murein DD-endopeptidase MepM/ murein hydrolase activator NlpD
VDFAAPANTQIVAARGGTVRHTNYGNAFGNKQFAIRTSDGGEDFYAHTNTRPANGAKVKAGQKIAKVGTRGNSTGNHLHFERHSKPGWSCSIMRDPKYSIAASAGKPVYLSKLKYGQRNSASVRRLQRALNAKSKSRGGKKIKVTGNYLAATDREVRLCQRKHGYGKDKPGKSSVGPKQAKHLFKGRNVSVKR